MKYIRAKVSDEIIVFPKNMSHASMALMLKLGHDDIVSAGFVSICNVDGVALLTCYGESTGLGIKAEDVEDTRILLKQFYGDGFFESLVNVTALNKIFWEQAFKQG